MQPLTWNRATTPPALHPMLEILGEEYPIRETDNNANIVFCKTHEEGLKIRMEDGIAAVQYHNTVSAARAMGALLAGVVEREFAESSPFTTLGVMIEASRNAVMKVGHFKKWLRSLALMGYNLVMLYTKDTYELPGEDYFGYLRGRYTEDELREVDAYADKLGIEMIGCIQTLGHLEPVLQWNAYAPIRDTSSVLLTTERRSYELIDKMLGFFGRVFRSRRIHIGMDETHDLGRGRFMDLHGYKRGYDIFCEHLDQVTAKCERLGLKPMIWSDMFFRMGSKTQDYYDKKCVIPADVKERVPRNVQLVYWDYYHRDEEFYRDWIRRHREFGTDPVMASAIWTWRSLWYNHTTTRETVLPCISACRKAKIPELIFTMWGDDGAYCDLDSALAGLCFAAENVYSTAGPAADNLEKRFNAVCKASFCDHLLAAKLSNPRAGVEDSQNQDNWKNHDIEIWDAMVLWDDPLLGIYWKNNLLSDPEFWHRALDRYADLEARLSACAQGNAGDMQHAQAIARALKRKITMKLKLEAAYADNDAEGLKEVRTMIPQVIQSIEELLASFRRMWYARFKTFGFEVMQIRFAGLRQRLMELDTRLDEYLAGTVTGIPELEEKPSQPFAVDYRFHRLATGSYFI